jgi:integrase
MPRHKSPPRLWLKPADRGRAAVWIIKDGEDRVGTGCGAKDVRGAKEALARYIDSTFAPPKGLGAQDLLIDEIVTAYLKDYAHHSRSREFLFATAKPILVWWSGKTLASVNGTACRAYVVWRTSQTYRGRNISDQSARHDLKTLRSAINWYKREVDTSLNVPTVTLPARAPARKDYWLSRQEVAARIRAARKSYQTRHVARMILIGVYTGTRPGASLALRWAPSTHAGWFDLEAGVLHRAGTGARQSNKRQPLAKIHFKLLPHLRRWRAADLPHGITNVVHYLGEPVAKLRRSWDSVARLAGSTRKDGPHVLRHTAATWQMRAGTDVFEAAGYLGMTVETLLDIYGHHHPSFQEKAARATGKRS